MLTVVLTMLFLIIGILVALFLAHILGNEVNHWGTILINLWVRYQTHSLRFETRRISLLHHLDSMSIVRRLYRTSFGDRMESDRQHDPKALSTAKKIRAIEILEADRRTQHL